MTALLRWSVYCMVTGRRSRAVGMNTAPYLAVGDDPELSYEEKLREYRTLADAYFETDAYRDFCASSLSHVDEVVLEWVSSADFDDLLVTTVRSTYPPAEQERFVAHFRGLVELWVTDQNRARGPR